MKEEDKKSLSILHKALTLGLGMIIILLCFMQKGSFSKANLFEFDQITTIVLLLALAASVLSKKVFQSRMTKISNPEDQFEDIRVAYITRWALLEGVGLGAMVCFLQFGNLMLVLIALLLWIQLLTSKPQFNY